MKKKSGWFQLAIFIIIYMFVKWSFLLAAATSVPVFYILLFFIGSFVVLDDIANRLNLWLIIQELKFKEEFGQELL